MNLGSRSSLYPAYLSYLPFLLSLFILAQYKILNRILRLH